MLSNIVLIGFMGCGKTLTSKALQSGWNLERLSTDELIEARDGRSIKQIFEESGESHFRQLEAEVVSEVSQRQGVVIDCGGGVVINPANVTKLKENGKIFFLSSDADVIFDRLKQMENRPLLNVDNPLEKIKELMAERMGFYQQADYTIDTNHGDCQKAAAEIMEIMSND